MSQIIESEYKLHHIRTVEQLDQNIQLLNKQDDQTNTILIVCMTEYNPSIDFINHLISKGANMDIQNNAGDTALILLFKNKNYHFRYCKPSIVSDIDIASILINNKCNINITNHKGENVMFYVMRYFCGFEEKNYGGVLATCSVCVKPVRCIIKLLDNNGYDFSIKNNKGHLATMYTSKVIYSFIYQLQIIKKLVR